MKFCIFFFLLFYIFVLRHEIITFPIVEESPSHLENIMGANYLLLLPLVTIVAFLPQSFGLIGESDLSLDDDDTHELDSPEYHEHSEKGIFELFFSDLFTECNCRCGVPNREAKLLGGEYLRTHEFPWLTAIQVRMQNPVLGALINNKYVLTSASQVIGLTPYDVKVTLGQFDRCFPDVTSQNISVSQIILHPDFSPGNRAFDIALVKLSTPVKFERRVRPICLSFPGQKYTGQVATVVGWAEGQIEGEGGPTDGQVSATCRPRKAGLPVLSQEECRATAFDQAYNSDDKGCIGIVGSRSLICQTDAGGPVMYRSQSGIYEIIGLLSDKNVCNDAPSTALFTRINVHLEWIKRNTRDACNCIRSEY